MEVTKRPWLETYPRDYNPDLKPTFRNLLEALNRHIKEQPRSPAIHYFNTTISFKEFGELIDAFALFLKDLGVSRGDRVALYLQNVPQFAIAQFAIWKIGAIVVPLNPMYKEKELSYYIDDASIKVIVCLESLYKNILEKSSYCLDKLQHIITTSELDFYKYQDDHKEFLKESIKYEKLPTIDFMAATKKYLGMSIDSVELNNEEIAYLTYTSGTTGPPKGAMNTHANVIFNSEVYRHCWRLSSKDIILGVAPLFHVTGMIGHIGVSVVSAAPLVLYYRFDPEATMKMIQMWRPTCTIGAITVFISLMNSPLIQEYDLSCLKKVYSGGAPVIPAVVERFERLTNAYIHNVYGLTETTSPATMVPLGMRAPVDTGSGAISIGLPVPGHEVKIMDLEVPHREVEFGEVGELAIKGPGVIPGYWNKPDETARAIRDGWLYTGDVGTMDEKGWVYLIDRKKDMIIASGFKVWPREVEDILYLHPAVREAAVVGVPDPYRGETVKAFVALKAGFEGKVKEEEIIAHCKERLAAYKYPRQVEFVREIPKTVTGKFLRRALRQNGNQ